MQADLPHFYPPIHPFWPFVLIYSTSSFEKIPQMFHLIIKNVSCTSCIIEHFSLPPGSDVIRPLSHLYHLKYSEGIRSGRSIATRVSTFSPIMTWLSPFGPSRIYKYSTLFFSGPKNFIAHFCCISCSLFVWCHFIIVVLPTNKMLRLVQLWKFFWNQTIRHNSKQQ